MAVIELEWVLEVDLELDRVLVGLIRVESASTNDIVRLEA